MADYSDAITKAKAAGYSDSEIANFLADKEPGIAKARGAGYGDNDIIGHLSGGGPSAPAAPQESLASDLGKSVASGLAQGSAIAMGMPGDLASLAHSIAPQGLIDKVKAIPGAQYVYDHLPTSQAITDYAVKNDTSLVDPNYEPQYATGRYTQAIARNAGPGLASGMGVPATLAGAVTGQAAYDATGSHLAEAGGNLAGAVLTPLALARAGRQALQPLKDAAAVNAEAKSVYNGPELASAMVSPQSLKDLALNTDQTLARRQFDPDAMREVRTVIDRWHNANQPQTIADLQNSRSRLGELSQGARTTQTAAAGAAKDHLDAYLHSLQPNQIVAGDAPGAVNLLNDANANWRYQNSASKVGNIIQKALDTAGSQNSGMNYGNLQRKGLLPLLDNDAAKLKQMGFGSPDDIDAVRTATQGDFATNLSRRASNMLGGGGGIASTAVAALAGKLLAPTIGGVAGGEEGYRHGGFLGSLAGAAAGAATGHGLRALANSRTRKAVQSIQDAILERAPANARIVAANRAARAANKSASARALAQGGIPAAAMLLSRFNSR